MRNAIPRSGMGHVVVILLDPKGDAAPDLFQTPILRRPDFLFFQAALEQLDGAVALWVMI